MSSNARLADGTGVVIDVRADDRIAHHSRLLVVQTPAVRDVVTTGRRLAHLNRSAHYGRSGLIVSGPARGHPEDDRGRVRPVPGYSGDPPGQRHRHHRGGVALASAEPPERKKIHREPAALDGLHGHIDAMLKANPEITTAAIWQQLADQHGVTVAYPIRHG
jgi:hypothetical protein